MRMREVSAGVAVVALAAAVGGCGSSRSNGEREKRDKPGYVCDLSGKGKSVKIGVDADQPGLGFQDGKHLRGMDVDIARCVAGGLGYGKVQFVLTNAPDREKVLTSGKVDMVVATFSITPARTKVISFAGPYFVTGQSVMVRTESPIKGVQDLKGKKVCSVSGTTSVDNLKKKQPDLKPEQYDSFPQCVLDLAKGRVDAMTTDEAILAGYSAQQKYAGKFDIVGSPFSQEKYGIGMKKGSASCSKVAEALKKVVRGSDWEKIVRNNLGVNFKYDKAANPPKDVTCS